MRNCFLWIVLAGSLTAAPAAARDGAMYLALQGGVTDFGDVDMDVDQTEDAMIMTTNSGAEYGVVFGYDFGRFRLEAEGTRKKGKMQQLRGKNGFDTDNVSPDVQELASIRGDIEVDALMANALFDIGGNGGVGVYAGAGLGYAWTQTDGSIDGVVGPFVDDSDNGFAWQLVTGLNVPVTRHLDLGARYRYFNVGGLNMNGPAGREYEAGYSTHSLLATLTLSFGGTPAR